MLRASSSVCLPWCLSRGRRSPPDGLDSDDRSTSRMLRGGSSIDRASASNASSKYSFSLGSRDVKGRARAESPHSSRARPVGMEDKNYRVGKKIYRVRATRALVGERPE